MFESSNYEKIVLLDFGISKIFKENLDTNITALSYYYSPPEISDSIKSRVTPKSDIFSFGMSSFFLLYLNLF